MKDESRPREEIERDKSKYELDEVQEHFAWSNEMLVDVIPYTKWLKLQEMKKNETK